MHDNNADGVWVSELLPHTARVAKDLCVVHSTFTEAINHDPAITYIQTGSQIPGRPSLGAWLSYGLGSMNRDLPHYVVMHAKTNFAEQSLFNRLWGTGFMPSDHQGILMRSQGDPVLYLSNPPGVTSADRRNQLDTLAAINNSLHAELGNPEILARIKQHEMAYRMQTSVPQLMDLSQESEETFRLYGDDAKTPGTFAACCLNARRLAERGVRNIQIFHRGWDAHWAIADRTRIAVQGYRPGNRRTDFGSEATRDVGRYACDLGWRVRADRLLSGETDSTTITDAIITRDALQHGWRAVV